MGSVALDGRRAHVAVTRRRPHFLFLLVVLLLLVAGPLTTQAWVPWSHSTASASSSHETARHGGSGGGGGSRATGFGPDRVHDYGQYGPVTPGHTNVDAQSLWTELQERARLSTCWKAMLVELSSSCRTVRGNNDLRSRLALGMAACDAEADGRMASVFQCAPKHKVQRCVQSLSEVAYSQFVLYRLHTDSLCTYLEAELYQERTEIAVAALRGESAATVQTLQSVQTASEDVRAQLVTAALAQEQQTVAAVALQAQLRALEQGQASALETLHGSADALARSSQQTADTLTAVKEGMANATRSAARSIDALASQSHAHFRALEGHTAGLLRILARLESAQRLLVEQMFSAHDGARGVIGATIVLLLTSFTRTAAARWPGLVLIAASIVVPPLMGWGARVRLLPHTAPVPMSGVGVVAALVLVVVVYSHSVSQAEHHRSLIRAEVERGVEQTVERLAQLLHAPTPVATSGAATTNSASPCRTVQHRACSDERPSLPWTPDRARSAPADLPPLTPMWASTPLSLRRDPDLISPVISPVVCTELNDSTETVPSPVFCDHDATSTAVVASVDAATAGQKRSRSPTCRASASPPASPTEVQTPPVKQPRRATPATKRAPRTKSAPPPSKKKK